ncbi:MAG TPA: enolase C-terminal domain-like protein [Chloroflexota bacterium]|nr:enolase C-terminal domain-like protein [Chloroflexota bacterium]
MKIERLELLKVPPSWVWLKIYTDDGITGLGEPYLEGHPESVIAEVQRLEPLLIGQDPRRIEDLWKKMYEAGLGYKGGPVTMSAISGIDIALWDIAGKAAGLPIYQLLGGACRDRVKMYRSVGGALPYCVEPGLPYRAGRGQRMQADRNDPQTWARAAEELVQGWGFQCLKVHYGLGDGLEAAVWIDQVAETFGAVREGAGPGVDVAVDLHNPHPSIARQLIEALAPFRPLFVEEPMPVERVDVLASVAAQTSLPIAAGERWMGKWTFFDALRQGALAVVQPDICHAGGISECKKIAAIAEAAYAKVALHCPLSPLSLAASIQVDACIPNFLVQEHNEVNDWRVGADTYFGYGYFANPFVLGADGCVAVPSGPGLGIELDDAGLKEIMQKEWSSQRG